MDYEFYNKAVNQMQAMKVRRDYIDGWIGGYMHNPKREEQRLSEAYEAGYGDGQAGATESFDNWIEN